jgi:hypothetical protein
VVKRRGRTSYPRRSTKAIGCFFHPLSERPSVGRHGLLRCLVARYSRGDTQVDERVEVAYGDPSAPKKLREPFEVTIAVHRPSACVTNDQGSKPLEISESYAQTDRSSPVLDHHRHPERARASRKRSTALACLAGLKQTRLR